MDLALEARDNGLCGLLYCWFVTQGVLYFQRQLFEQWSGHDHRRHIKISLIMWYLQ
jgi:hypothetical protein